MIHEGELMDASIVPDPDPTIQSCYSERRCARVCTLWGHSALAAVAHTIAQNSTV